MDNNRNNPENKGAKKPLDSKLITIIIAAVAVVVLIALLVPTIIALNSKNADIEKFNTQVEELKGKIATLESAEHLSAEDVEAAIKTAIEGIDIPAAGLSETQIQALIDAAIEGLADIDSVLTEEEIAAIVSAAIAELEIPEAGITDEEVQELIADAIAGIELPEEGITDEEVQELIADAIAGIEIPEAGLSEEGVRDVIADVLLECGLIKPNAEDLTLAENIAIANDVVLAEDTTLSESVSLLEGEYMLIDLNGKTLVLDEYALIDVSGDLRIKNGNIIVKSAAAFGLVVSEEGELTLRDVKVTLTGTGAHGVTNYGEAKIIACEFEIDDTTADYNCAIYNSGEMRVKNSSVKEVGTDDVVYIYGAPIYNTDTLIMNNVEVASSAFCTSTFGGSITVDTLSTFTLTGEKQLTPDGDYFAYNAHNGTTPTSNDCYEFRYFGKAEKNQANLDFKAAFANGGSVTLTDDAVIGSAFTVADGKTVVINLGGNTLTLNENAYFVLTNGNVTVKNGTVVAKTYSDDALYCFTVSSASSLTFDGVTFNNESSSDGIYNAGTLVINDSSLTTAEGCGGVSGSLVYNYTGKSGVEATATITNSTIDNTAAISEEFFPITPVINYGTMTLDKTTVNSNTSCIYQGSYLAKTVIIDGAMNHGNGDKCAVVFAESASFLFGTEADVTWTVNGEEVEVSVIYMHYNDLID